MDRTFVAKPLEIQQIDQAFPVLRAIAPELGLERWRAFAGALIGDSGGSGGPRGIMTVQNERGYIHGLFTYSVDEDLRHGRILSAGNFVVLDLFDLAGATTSLLEALEGLAGRFSCTSIRTALNLPGMVSDDYCGTLPAAFRTGGHTVESVSLCKVLAGGDDTMSQVGDDAGGAA